MKTLAYFLRFLIGIATVLTVFIAFHPEAHNKYDFWKDLTSFNPVTNRVKDAIANEGLYKVITLYIVTAPVFEEIAYRGPLWLLCVILRLFGLNHNHCRGRNALLWPVLVIPTLAWSLLHPYPPIFQAFVFLGGIFNGTCIIYLLEEKWSRASIFGSIVLVIYMHAVFNLFIILIVQLL